MMFLKKTFEEFFKKNINLKFPCTIDHSSTSNRYADKYIFLLHKNAHAAIPLYAEPSK